jgi:hypothetical protein
MTSASQAARDLASLSHESRRRRTAAVKRVIAAYRPLRPDLASADDVTLLGELANELEADLAEQPSASAS